MAFKGSKREFLFTLVVMFATLLHISLAGDPDITSDFIVPPNLTKVDGSLFTYTGLRVLFGEDVPKNFEISKASMKEFPALNGQSVSHAVLQFPAGTVNPPHTHPRSAELLFLIEGSLEVGFIDTTNKLFTQTLQTGDLFIFPKGLIHFQYNNDAKKFAIAISAFGSANAGTVSIPGAVFNTSINNVILAKSFKTNVATIRKIKAGLIAKA